MKHVLNLVLLCALLAAVSACGTSGSGVVEPPRYTEDAMNQAAQLVDHGYAQLDSNDVPGALTTFEEAGKLVPCGYTQEYNSACAQARSGNKDAAFDWLTKLADNGWDNAERLEYDPDFESLRSDPRYAKLIERFNANWISQSAVLAQGLPEGITAPVKFANEDSLRAWVREQDRVLRQSQNFWNSFQGVCGQIFERMRILAARNELKAGDTAWNADLERVRLASALGDRYGTGWGAVADLVKTEADRFIKTNPPAVMQEEANYLVGSAFCRKCKDDDPMRKVALQVSDTYLAKVAEGSEFHPVAQALMAVNKLKSPDATEYDAAKAQVRAVVEKYPGDQYVYHELASRLSSEVVSYLWPIALEAVDIDGKQVSLDEYRGKVLLIDFWATWCPPCRASLPSLREVYGAQHDKGLEVLSISLDKSDWTTPEAYRAWADSAGMSWRHVYDGQYWSCPLAKRFFVASIPTALLVGPDGSLVAWGEDLHAEKLAATVERAIATVKK